MRGTRQHRAFAFLRAQTFDFRKAGIQMNENHWLKVEEAAARAQCGPGTIRREVRRGHLRGARLGGRRELRFLLEFVDAWLLASEAPNRGEEGKAESD